MEQGTRLLLKTIEGLADEDYDAPTLLPGWTRKNLIAHVAANADALGNLVEWAATGQVTPMYASPEERAAGILRGPQMNAAELSQWLTRSAHELADAAAALTKEQRQAKVLTAQGRTVLATEIPWMRTREVWIHAVDLDLGITFADLPPDLLAALVEDICAKRGLESSALPDGPLPDVAAWLAGRPHGLTGTPSLGPWL
ncbi:hypothetical protein GCM10023350_09710 [Nocardioides endophyticus]|uniref:Mycothiol-dependent maleylpyruvate isomerase metal-binding domain-containing protein n=1 Tax=Nocardioides endophyticus TaxID=1353775 RepID=A0ABP8YFB8_9ACTN